MDKLILIDSNSLINRAFHALPPLQISDGSYTNAVFGYISMLQKLIAEEKPTHICAVFDCHAKTFRHMEYPDYKGTRKPAAPELIQQIPVLQKLLGLMGIKIMFIEGLEADDIIGTIAKRFDTPTIIVTGDKDSLQLLDNTTKVYFTKRGVSDVFVYTPETLLENDGFTPNQIIEYKGLAGDSSDNIPGCVGVGEKTAKELLKAYDNIDGVYAHIGELKGKLKERLTENENTVRFSKKLATIKIDADFECKLNDMIFSYPLPENAKLMMQELQFKKLTDRFEYIDEGKVFGKDVQAKIKHFSKTDDVLHEIRNISKGDTVYIEWEDQFVFAYKDTEVWVKISFDLFGDGVPSYELTSIFELLLQSDFKLLFFDAKQYMKKFDEVGVKITSKFDDILLKAYLINSNKIVKDGVQLLSDYNYQTENKAVAMLDLDKELSKLLNEMSLEKLYYELELPLIRVLYSMEKCGFLIDINVLEDLNRQYATETTEILEDIYRIAGEEFNVNSNKQLGEILFGKLGLPHAKKNKTGFSVSAEVLEELEHPIVSLLLRYRQITKLKSTYLEGIKAVMNKKTFRVHTVFKQCLTATGRLSSTEPNLQNIPIRRAEGREIRRMFLPSKGCQLVTADYSQIELRLLAHFSQDESLINAYKNGIDIHSLTASKIFKTPLENLTSEQRSAAKAVNFGIIYGISSFGLAKNAEVSNAQAKLFIEQYFNTYKSVKEYMQKNVALAKENGYLSTLLGRRRYFPELTSSQYAIRAFGERAAMNMPLQGSASDIIKLAMLKVDKALSTYNLKAKLILQVHDELIIDTPDNEVETVKKLLQESMENVVNLLVPLTVNVAVGKNWFEAK